MSNHWGYACVSHDPPILMDEYGGEGGRPNHAFDALVAALPIVREGRWPMVRSYPDSDVLLDVEPTPVVGTTGSEGVAPIRFLFAHPRCRIAIFDEYGCTWTESATGWRQVSGHDERLSRRPVRDAAGSPTGDWVRGDYPPEGMSECSCYQPTPVFTHPSLVPWEDGWVLCTSCGGTHLANSSGER